MSWMATMWPLRISSRLASSSSFSVNGSPTCTIGRFASLADERSSEANDAPWMPSRPVRAPDGDDRVADALGDGAHQLVLVHDADAHRR
jgi:hypothetical protein